MKGIDVSSGDIRAARQPVAELARSTPSTQLAGYDDVHLKLENLQRTGSFKLRGAWNKMRQATAAEREAGFITVSAGNHGRAVAFCARRLGAPCTIWVPEPYVEAKVDAMRSLGAAVQTRPHDEIMEGIAEGRWADGPETFVHPFADPAVVAGQGTVGLEMLDQLDRFAQPDELDQPEALRTVLVPVGGGGLISGIGLALEHAAPDASLVAVEAEGAAALNASLAAGRPMDVGPADTFADGISPSRVFEPMWPLLERLVDEAVTVTDDEIRTAMRTLALDAHVVAEPAGAAATAAWMVHGDRFETPAVCIVSGGNVGPGVLVDVLEADG